MNKISLKVVGLLLVVGASWIWIYRTLDSRRVDLDPYEALGRGAAKATAKLLGDAGEIVLVSPTFGEFKMLAPMTEAQIKAFKKAIGRTGVKIAAVEKVAIVPPSMARSGVFMQPGQLASLLSRHPKADAVILFAGLAAQDNIKAVLAANGKPKLVLVANYEPHYRALVGSKVIQLAIVPKNDQGHGASSSESSDSFERNYLVVTPENAAQLPE